VDVWERQLVLLQSEFHLASRAGYFVGLALASGFAESEPAEGQSSSVEEREAELRHEAFEKREEADRDALGNGLLTADSLRDLTGKEHKPRGPFDAPWKRTRRPAKTWAPAKSFSWCGIWGDAAGVQRFTALANCAAQVLPGAFWGCDEPLFCPPIPPEGRRWSADPLSRWAQFTYVWCFTSFARTLSARNPSIRFAQLSGDAFLTSAMAIGSILGQKPIPIAKRFRRQYKGLEALLANRYPGPPAKRLGKPRNLDVWRPAVLKLRDQCRKGDRIDHPQLLRRVHEECVKDGIVIPADDQLTGKSLRTFLDLERQWKDSV